MIVRNLEEAIESWKAQRSEDAQASESAVGEAEEHASPQTSAQSPSDQTSPAVEPKDRTLLIAGVGLGILALLLVFAAFRPGDE